MARILVSLRNGWRRPDDFNAMPPFYETFLQGLKQAGNNVFCFHHKEYNRDFSGPIPEGMKTLIKQFDPELCILFNNTFWDISTLVDCPILIYDVDSPIEYTHTDNLKENPSRYTFIINQKDGADLMEQTFQAPRENIFYIPFFTAVQSDKEIDITNNIVFLGSNWTWHGYNFLQSFLKKNPIEKDIREAKIILSEFSKHPFENSKKIYDNMEIHPQKPLDISDIRRAAYEVSGLYRMKVLSAVADLGLEIRGQYWDIDCMNYFPELMLCVNKTPTYSLRENQDFYNSAKISLNTQHIQTVSGFSFRVCDVMASNACLVTSPSQDLKELFPNVGIPMFNSPYEAREICKTLLAEENMRLDIVEAAHLAIEKGYRIENVISCLEEITDIKLNNKKSGVYVQYEFDAGFLDIYSDEDPSLRKPTIRSTAPILVPPVRGAKKNSVAKPVPGKPVQTAKPVPVKPAQVANSTTKSSLITSSSSKKSGKKLSPICSIWYKTLGKHLGYDPYDKFEKKTYYIGKMLVYEKLFVSKERTETYFLALPLLSRTKQGNRTKIKILLLEKIGRSFKKMFTKKTPKVAKEVPVESAKIVSATPVQLKPECDFRMPSGQELAQYYKQKDKNREEIRNKIANHEKVKVCLFVCRISCWLFDDLYKMLESSEIFEPTIVVKPFLTMGQAAMIEYMNTTFDILQQRGYRVVKSYDEETNTFINIRQTINPDIVFYTKYWPPQFRPEYYIKQFLDKLTFYIPYAYDIGRHDAVYKFDLLNYVDRFFYNTEIHKEMAEKYMPNKGKNVYIVGAPKLDVFFDKTYVPKDVWKEQKKKKKRIIWAPHHEDQTKDDMYQFDAFFYLCDYMFEIASKYEDLIQIAFKPHPMLKPKLDYRWGKEAADKYYDKWDNLPNGQLEVGEFKDLFLTSDAMILDSVSFVAEYMAVNKPMLFTVSPTSRVMFNEFGEEAFKRLYSTNGKTIEKDIDDFVCDIVIGGNDPKLSERTDFIQSYIIPPNGRTATENIYDNILDEIQNGDKKQK